MTRRPGVTAIVLAGGRSSRFGSPKLAAELDGLPLLEHALRAAGSVADEIIVAGAPAPNQTLLPNPDPVNQDASPIRTVADDEAFAGPLAALAGALRVTATARAIVVGGDMPGLVPAVLGAMLRRLASNEDLDAVLLAQPRVDTLHRQVLPLALSVAAASAAAAEAVGAGDRSLVRLVGRLRSIEIPASEWLALDPGGLTLLDIDRPADLERIRREFR